MNQLNLNKLAALVYKEFRGRVHTLRSTSRGKANDSLCRQITVYLGHVVYPGTTMTDIGKLMKRDRTTIAHACIKIEDMREDPEFDERLTKLENKYLGKDK